MTSKAYHEAHVIKNMTNSKNKGIRTESANPAQFIMYRGSYIATTIRNNCNGGPINCHAS